MTRFSRGDVVLVPFPFTDATTAKQRPAVIVSSAEYMSQSIDLLVAMVTSKVKPTPRIGDHRLKGWRHAGLIAPSRVRARIATIDQRRVIKRLGSITTEDMAAIERGLRRALAL